METLAGIIISALWSAAPLVLYSVFVEKATWGVKDWKNLTIFAIVWGAIPAFSFMALVPLVALSPASEELFDPSNQMMLVCVVVPLAEETLKTLAILSMLVFCKKKALTVADGLIYGSLVGLGFGMVEDFWYYVSSLQAGGISLATETMFARGLLSAFNHSVYSGTAGAILGIAFQSPRPAKWIWASMSLALPSILHAVYNFTAIISDDLQIGVYPSLIRVSAMIVNALISASGVLLIFAVSVSSWRELKFALERELIPFEKDENIAIAMRKFSSHIYPPLLLSNSEKAMLAAASAIIKKGGLLRNP